MQDGGELASDATRARARPRALATFMPQARRLDHLRLRTSKRVSSLGEGRAGELVAAAACRRCRSRRT